MLTLMMKKLNHQVMKREYQKEEDHQEGKQQMTIQRVKVKEAPVMIAEKKMKKEHASKRRSKTVKTAAQMIAKVMKARMKTDPNQQLKSLRRLTNKLSILIRICQRH